MNAIAIGSSSYRVIGLLAIAYVASGFSRTNVASGLSRTGVASGFSPPLRAVLRAELRRDLAEAQSAKAGSRVEPTQDVTVRTSLDRTAIWVADRVTYTIELTCSRGVDVLADDLSRDKLKAEGLDVIDADTDRRSSSDGGTLYRFRYVLTTYRTDVPVLTIAPLRVRYAVRRSGQRLEDAAPAGDVQVPGATVAFRSVLPDDQDLRGIRSDKPPHARAIRFAALQLVGIALVIVAIVPGALAIAAFVRRIRRPRVRRSARAVRHEERASLEAVRQVNVDAIDARRQVFTDLDALLRQHLRDVCGVPAASLTPHEVPFALASVRSKVDAELIASVLEACELARYAPPHAIPSADACRDAISRVEQLIEHSGARGFSRAGDEISARLSASAREQSERAAADAPTRLRREGG